MTENEIIISNCQNNELFAPLIECCPNRNIYG